MPDPPTLPTLCNYGKTRLWFVYSYWHSTLSFKWNITRMHSSKMRTVLSSGRLGGGCMPRVGVCLGVHPRGCLPRGGCVCLGRRCLPGDVYLPPLVDRILDTCLWKHYLSATSFADGKYISIRRRKYLFYETISTRIRQASSHAG